MSPPLNMLSQLYPSYSQVSSGITKTMVITILQLFLSSTLCIPGTKNFFHTEGLFALFGASKTFSMIGPFPSRGTKELPLVLLFHIGAPPFLWDGFPPDFRAFFRLWAVFTCGVVSQGYPRDTADTGATIGSTVQSLTSSAQGHRNHQPESAHRTQFLFPAA